MDRSLVFGPIVLIFAISIFGPDAHASLIIWGGAQNTTSAADILNTGDTIQALNYGPTNTGSLTVNGVVFANDNNILENTNSVNFSPFTVGEGDFHSLINLLDSGRPNGFISGDGAVRSTVSLASGLLTVGQQYQIQIFYTDDRFSSTSTRVMRFDDGNAANFVDLKGGGSDGVRGGEFHGQYVIGTFTADADFQTLGLDALGFAQHHINAMQIRSVPEPSGVSIFALGAAGILAHRRRKRKA